MFFSDAQNGSLNLSRFVRMLIKCLFTDDELVVGSIKYLDKHKISLMHEEASRWYNCNMTEVRQVMSFRLSEIRKTKGAQFWNKRNLFGQSGGQNLQVIYL